MNNRKKLTKLFRLFIASIFLLGGLAACQPVAEEESPVPWNKPANWEGQGPIGMQNRNFRN